VCRAFGADAAAAWIEAHALHIACVRCVAAAGLGRRHSCWVQSGAAGLQHLLFAADGGSLLCLQGVKKWCSTIGQNGAKPCELPITLVYHRLHRLPCIPV